MKEEWRDVTGFEQYYSISNTGRVYSKERYVHNNGGTFLKKGKIIKPFDNGTGYLQTNLCVDGKSYKKYIHRMVGEAFIPQQDTSLDLHHKDHNKKNNSVDNLEWLSRKENLEEYYKYAENKGIYTRKSTVCECGENKSRESEICHKCYRNNSSKRSVEERFNLSGQDLYEMLLENSFKKVSDTLGVSYNTIRKACKRLGIPDKPLYYRENGNVTYDWNRDCNNLKVKVDMLDMEGNYIRTFNSILEANAYVGGKGSGNISRCINGKIKSSMGYKWRYSEKG